MARGRIISIQVASDDSLNKLSPDAERLYLRTLPHLDRDGLITGHPMLLWAKAAPLRMELMDKCNAIIQEWVQQGLVITYPGADGQPVLYFKGFRRHNANIPYKDEAPSIYPPPPGWYRGKTGLIPEDGDACFRLAQLFDSRSAYRQELEKTLTGREEVATTSRGGREEVEYKEQDQDQDQSNHGGGGVQNTPHTHLGSGNGGDARGGAPNRLISALAELSDDDLRMAADGIGSTLGLAGEFNGWTRMLAGATRAELMLICAWGWKWGRQSAEEMASVRSYPALLNSKLKSGAFPDGLTTWQIHEIRDQVEEAARLMAIPVEEL